MIPVMSVFLRVNQSYNTANNLLIDLTKRNVMLWGFTRKTGFGQ